MTSTLQAARPVVATARINGAGRRAVTRWSRWWPWAMAAVVTLMYAAVSVQRYRQGIHTSWDLAIFTQSVQSYAHGHLPISTVRGGPGFDLLGDHFSPAVAVLAPGYRLFPSPIYLLVCQAGLFGVSVVPIARLAARRLGHPAAVLVGVAYSLSWGLQQAVVVDFHEVALAVPLIAAGACAMVERRWSTAAMWLLPLVLVKEDLGLTVAVAGGYLVCHRVRRLGWSMIVGGVAASALEMIVFIPAVSGHGYGYTGSLGGHHSPWQMVTSLAWPEPKLTTLCLLAGIAAFACLRSPIILLAVPTLLWRFESDTSVYWGNQWHYSAVLMPIVFVALVDAIGRMQRSRRRFIGATAARLPAVVATIAVMAVHSTPLGAYLHEAAYRQTDQGRTVAQVEKLVPPGSSVETDIGLMSHLTAGRRTYFVGNHTSTITPEFVVIDQSAWSGLMQGDDVIRYAQQLHPDARYRLIFQQDGITVVRLLAG